MSGPAGPARSVLQQAFRVALPGLFGALAVSAQAPGYIGAGGCASSNCHGATTPAPLSQSRILGNEYSIWSVRDKHSQAYSVLSNERSKRMAEIVGVGDPTKAENCLSCHAVGSTAKFISDGVSCEACHGPAEKWRGRTPPPTTATPTTFRSGWTIRKTSPSAPRNAWDATSVHGAGGSTTR